MSHLLSRLSAYATEGQIKDRPLPHRYGNGGAACALIFTFVQAAGQLASAWLRVAGIEQTPHWLACHLRACK
jgi:hypothetical protein